MSRMSGMYRKHWCENEAPEDVRTFSLDDLYKK